MSEIDLTQFEGHTPGPWVIERASSGAINEIGPLLAEEYAGFAWLQVSNEDARLIAAAPDLLAAYKAALARAEAAEAEVKKLAEELKHCDILRATWLSLFNKAERQRDEAFTAGAEAMREALLGKVDFSEVGFDYVSHGTIRALPIPAQEK